MAAYSFYDDLKSVPAWYLAIDALVAVFWIMAVFAYYDARLTPPGAVGVVSFVAAVLWTAWDVQRELQGIVAQRPEGHDPELSPKLNLWIDRGVEATGVVVASALLAPAVVFALRVVQRGFGPSP
jgi:hypothetical protein